MDSERIITGLYLEEPGRLAYLESVGIEPEMFVDADLGLAYGAARVLYKERRMAGPSDLLDHIGPKLERGVSNLKDCLADSMGRAISGEMALHSARVVDSWRKRELMKMVGEFYHHAQADNDPLETVRRFQEMANESTRYTTAPAYFKPLETPNAITRVINGTYKVPVTPTGYRALDEMIGGGWHNGRVNVFAAGTGQGKSNLALASLDHIQETTGRHVLYMTPELPRDEIEIRRAARRCRVDSYAIRTGNMTHIELDRLRGLDLDHKILIDEYAIPTVDYFRKRVLELHALYGLAAVAFDYVERIWGQGKIFDRIMELMIVGEQMAKILGVPVIMISQLNREAMSARRPGLDNLANGSALEKLASMVLGGRWHKKNHDMGGIKPLDKYDDYSYTIWPLKNTYGPDTGALDLFIEPQYHDLSVSGNDLPF